MEKSHLVAILRTFSPTEERQFRKWLRSPLHNQREDVDTLFNYLTKNGRLQRPEQLTKAKVFKKLFPKQTFDDARLRQTIHFLFKAVEEFLIYRATEAERVRSQIALAGVYRRRRLDKLFSRTIRQAEQLQNDYPFRDEQYFQHEYELEKEKYRFLEDQKRNIPVNLQEVADATDTEFIVNKLKQTCLMLSHQLVFKSDYAFGLLPAVLRYVQENQTLLDVPAIALYYYVYFTMVEPEREEYYQRLHAEINRSLHLFSPQESRDLLLLAINYCIKKMNQGRENYVREAFGLYQKGLDEAVFLNKEAGAQYTFRNIVSAGLRLKEFDWVEEFIETYQDALEPRHRPNFVAFNRAKLYYERNDYERAMELLSQTDFDDLLINLNAKTMLLKIYYELDALDAMESLLSSMRVFIQRKEIMGYHKANYRNVVTYTRKLLKVNPFDQQEIQKLAKEIGEINPLTEKRWLQKQLQRLEE